MWRTLKRAALGLLALLVVIQLVPYGRAHTDTHATREARFATESTQRLFDGACADCHSDHTSWPAYSNIAPISWLVQRDVDDGRGDAQQQPGSAQGRRERGERPDAEPEPDAAEHGEREGQGHRNHRRSSGSRPRPRITRYATSETPTPPAMTAAPVGVS